MFDDQEGRCRCAVASGAAKSKVIAFLMPCSTCADRFESKDKPYFIQAVHDLDPSIKVIANNAQGSGDTQLQQAESALDQRRQRHRDEPDDRPGRRVDGGQG